MSNEPVVERHARCVLLDIEGTVSDIRFVYDVMFPYAAAHMPGFLVAHWSSTPVQNAIQAMAQDAGFRSGDDWLGTGWKTGPAHCYEQVVGQVKQLMSQDSKSTGLKMLQGLVWEAGFKTGSLRAELFDDVVPAIKGWHANGLDLRIYSSGSVLAQQMFFGHTTVGDLRPLLSAHYDTLVGPKREADSYRRIAQHCKLDISSILFLTDVHAEIVAANDAGMQAVAVVRPNNAPLPVDFHGDRISSFANLKITLP